MNRVMLSLIVLGSLSVPAIAAKKEPIVCLFNEVYDQHSDSCVPVEGNDSFLNTNVSQQTPNDNSGGNDGSNGDGNNGHGNDRDGHDESNPGKSDGPKGKGHGKHGD